MTKPNDPDAVWVFGNELFNHVMVPSQGEPYAAIDWNATPPTFYFNWHAINEMYRKHPVAVPESDDTE